jgi:hypothetical protein
MAEGLFRSLAFGFGLAPLAIISLIFRQASLVPLLISPSLSGELAAVGTIQGAA